MKSKKFFYTWEDYSENSKNAGTMIDDILADPELPQLDQLVIGCWGESWDNSAQPIIDGIDFEECEVSWIEQADYSKLWAAMPQLEELTIKGSTNLSLGSIEHENLKGLEIICGGLPKEVMASIGAAKLPALKRLSLYMGVEDYGFDGGIEDIASMLEKSDFPQLEELGILDSEIQDEVAEAVVKSRYMKQIHTLDLSCGTMTDKGGQCLLDELPKYENIKEVDLSYHYMSDEMMEKLEALEAEVDVDDQQEDDEYDGEIYRYPMLTE